MTYKIEWRPATGYGNSWREEKRKSPFRSKEAAIREARELNRIFKHVEHRVVDADGWPVWTKHEEDVSEEV